MPLDRFRLRLIRTSDSGVALDTVIPLAPGDTTVDLAFTVRMLSTSERFLAYLTLITPAGDTAFRAGPDTVAPSSGGPPPAPQPVQFTYVGVGANAAGVRILTVDPRVFFQDTVELVAEAFDSGGQAIAETPIAWTSLDTVRARVPDPGTGLVLGRNQRGMATITATLLTGPADTTGVLVQPFPVRVSIDSGNGQTAAVGTALANPIVALVKAADSLGVAGAVVRFAIAPNAGTLTTDSGVTNEAGRASVGWTLGTIAGVYALTAKVTGIPDSLAPATATALPTDATPNTSVVTVSSGTVTAGSAVTLTLQARDAQGNPLTGDGLTVVFTATGGTSTGTISPTTDQGDGTYTATFTGVKAGTPTTVGATMDGEPVTTPLPTVTVTAAAATRLAFAGPPANAVAGAILTPGVLVKALDPFNNIDPSFTGTITIALGDNPGPGTLFGTLSKAATAGGVAFENLMIDTQGVGYTLVATSGALTPATSTAFDITTPTPAVVLWVNPAGGNWNNPVNWIADPAGSPLSRVPTVADTVFINQPGIYTVTLDVDAHVAFLFVGGGGPTDIQTLAIGGPTLTHDSLAKFVGGGSGMGVLNLSGGSITSADTIVIAGGAFNWTGGTLTGGGALLNAFGTMSLGGGPKTLTNYEVANLTPATWSAGNIIASSGGKFVNDVGGTLSITGSVTFVNGGGTPPPAFENGGTLDVQAGATLRVQTAFTHAPVAVLQGNGTLDLATAPSVVFDGDVNPGTSPGILGITGPLPLSSVSTVNLELNGTVPGTGHDQLNVSGAVTLNGTLNLITGLTPTPGDQFQVLTFGSRGGGLPSTTGFDLYPTRLVGLALDTTWSATNLTVRADGQIAFSADSGFGQVGVSGLFRTNTSTAFRVNVNDEGKFTNSYPRWAPDRKRLTYTANNLLHIIEAAAASTPVHLVRDTLSRRARYSPNGMRIAFECGGSLTGFNDVCTIANVTIPIDNMGDGTGKAWVTDSIDVNLGGTPAYAWNPTNSDQLAVVRDVLIAGAATSRIYTVAFDGKSPVTVTTLPPGRRVIQTMDWSPDGSTLAFGVINDTTFAQQIWTLKLAGAVLDTVSFPVSGETDFSPVFSPDGTEILFARASIDIDYVVARADGGGERVRIPGSITADGGDQYIGHDWSPDGSQLILLDEDAVLNRLVYVVPKSVTAGTYTAVRRAVGRTPNMGLIRDKHPTWRP